MFNHVQRKREIGTSSLMGGESLHMGKDGHPFYRDPISGLNVTYSSNVLLTVYCDFNAISVYRSTAKQEMDPGLLGTSEEAAGLARLWI